MARPEIGRAVEILRVGGLVAMPTETVYGLAADATNQKAVERIFAAKGRPTGHPLIVHLGEGREVLDWSDSNDSRVGLLADALWPGPLTVIVPRNDRVAPATVGSLDTIGLRVPDHPVALELLRRFGGGLAAPSANRFGRVSPTTADHVRADLGDRVDIVLDGGPCGVGLESTIVEVVGERVVMLRPGGVSLAVLELVLGESVEDGTAGESRAAGMMRSHYAPRAEVVVVGPQEELPAGALVIAGKPVEGHETLVLSSDSDGFAAGLYSALREADNRGAAVVAVIPPGDGPLSAAVADRLAKASAPRPNRRDSSLGPNASN